MQPGNPIVGGTVLRYPAIQSPNYVAGSTGWIINEDGTAEFNSLSIHGSIVIGSGSNNVIILDFARRAIFVYDAFAHLVASIAASGGSDSFLNSYQGGINSYLGGNVNSFIRMLDNQLSIASVDANEIVKFAITPNPTGNSGPGNNQPLTNLNGASDATAYPLMELFGANVGGSAAPFFRYRNGNGTAAIDMLIQGIAKWSATGAANYAETWHALPLSTNWINQGAPFGNGSYRRMPDGTVRFTGAIAWTAAAANAPVQVCTALPADYRPLSQKRCMTMSMGVNTAPPTVESFDIHTDGTVWITSFANGTGPLTPITLDNVSYPIDG
jgi:hypothetical protein